MPKRNVELLRKVADTIEKEPQRYLQADWARYGLVDNDDGYFDWEASDELCGTVCCVAGHAIIENGGSVRRHRSERTEASLYSKGKRKLIGSDVPEYAQRLLGLSEDEADVLFSGDMIPRNYRGRTHKAQAKAVARALRKIADGAPVRSAVSYGE